MLKIQTMSNHNSEGLMTQNDAIISILVTQKIY